MQYPQVISKVDENYEENFLRCGFPQPAPSVLTGKIDRNMNPWSPFQVYLIRNSEGRLQKFVV
jgi:hypothetical protein